MSTVQLYPDTLEQVAAYARALSDACESLPDGDGEKVHLGRVEVMDQYGEHIGYLVDEVGGSFMFVGKDWYDDMRVDEQRRARASAFLNSILSDGVLKESFLGTVEKLARMIR